MTYTARKGSYPALAWEALGPDGELSTSALAEAIGCTSDSLGPLMLIPVKHGYLTKERRNGLNWWRRGTGVPPAVPHGDNAVEKPLHKPPRTDGALPAASIFDLAKRQAEAAPSDEPPDAPRPVIWPGTRPTAAKASGAAAAPVAFRCGLFDDGELVLQRGGEVFTLEREHTRQLVAYLDRLALEPTE